MYDSTSAGLFHFLRSSLLSLSNLQTNLNFVCGYFQRYCYSEGDFDYFQRFSTSTKRNCIAWLGLITSLGLCAAGFLAPDVFSGLLIVHDAGPLFALPTFGFPLEDSDDGCQFFLMDEGDFYSRSLSPIQDEPNVSVKHLGDLDGTLYGAAATQQMQQADLKFSVAPLGDMFGSNAEEKRAATSLDICNTLADTRCVQRAQSKFVGQAMPQFASTLAAAPAGALASTLQHSVKISAGIVQGAFVGQKAGAYTVSVSLAGSALQSKVSVTVTSGSLVASMCKVSGTGLLPNRVAGSSGQLAVAGYDAFGNAASLTGGLTYSLAGPSTLSSSFISGSATLTPTVSGVYTLEVFLDSVPIPLGASPAFISVSPAAASAAKSEISTKYVVCGTGFDSLPLQCGRGYLISSVDFASYGLPLAQSCMAYQRQTIPLRGYAAFAESLQARSGLAVTCGDGSSRDQFSNVVAHSGYKFDFKVLQNGVNLVNSLRLTYSGNGKYTGSFKITKIGSYIAEISVSGNGFNGAVVKSRSTRVVAGSTPDIKNTFCQGSGLSSAVAGETAMFTVTLKDTSGNILRDGTRVVQSWLSVVNDANAMSVSVGSDGVYVVSYVPRAVGSVQIFVSVDGKDIGKKLYTTVTAGRLYAPSSGLTSSSSNSGGSLLQSTAGTSTSFSIQGRDAYGNSISSLPPGVVLHEAKSYTTQSSCVTLCNSDSVILTQKTVPGTNYTVSFKVADLRVCGCSNGVSHCAAQKLSWIGRTLKVEALVNGELADTFVGSGTNSWVSLSSPGNVGSVNGKLRECLSRVSCTVSVNSANFGTPCDGGSSFLAARVTCSGPALLSRVQAGPMSTFAVLTADQYGNKRQTNVPSVADRGDGIWGNTTDIVVLPCSSYSSTVNNASASYSSTVEKQSTVSYTANNTPFLVPRKGGSRPSSPTPSPHQGKARHVPPIPVGPYSAGTLPLRGSSSAAPTPLLLQEGGKVSRTGAVAGASPSGAAPATLPLSGVDARSCHYFCGGDEHRTLSLPHGREVRSAVPHCLVLPSGEEKRQPFAALVSKGAKVVSSPTGSVLPALYAAFRALGQQASLEDPGGEAVSDVGSPTRTTSPPRRSQFSPGPLSSQTGSVVEGCGVLSPLSGGAVARVCVKMGGNSHCLRRAAGPLCGAASVRTVDYVCVMGGCLQRRSTPPYRWCAVGAVCLVDRPCQRFVLPGVVVRGGTSAPTNCTAAFTTVASSLVLTDATVSPSQVNSTDTDATVYSKTTASPSSSTTLTSLPAAQDNPPLSLPVVGRGGGGAAAEKLWPLSGQER